MTWENIKALARDWLVATAIVFGLWFVWVQFANPPPKSSGPAPSFALTSLDGEEVTTSTLPHTAVLNFWFTSCGPCRHEIPELATFHTKHPEIPLYGISVDTMAPKRLGAIGKKLGINYPVLQDAPGKVAGAFGVSLFPTTVVIHEGEIAAVKLGEINASGLEALVRSVH